MGRKQGKRKVESEMEKWGQDKRRDVVLVDIDQLVPADHMLRKIEEIYESQRLGPGNTMGHAEICMHEFEKAGKLAVGSTGLF